MKVGDYVLVNAKPIWQKENMYKPNSWIKVQITEINDKEFSFSREDLKYIYTYKLSDKKMYKEIKK